MPSMGNTCIFDMNKIVTKRDISLYVFVLHIWLSFWYVCPINQKLMLVNLQIKHLLIVNKTTLFLISIHIFLFQMSATIYMQMQYKIIKT